MDPAFTHERVPFLDVSSRFIRGLCPAWKAGRRRLAKDGIRSSLPSPHSGGASSFVGGRVEACLWRIYV